MERGNEKMYERRNIEDICRQLNTDKKRGLTEGEAEARKRKNGANELKEAKTKTAFETFLEQLNDPLIYVLLAAAAVSFLLHEPNDAIIILVVVLVNAVVGMIQEGKAKRALESLRKLTSPKAYVIRDGIEREIPASELVVGGLVCLEAGCQIPADLRLVETRTLKVEESALTGESLPIEKNADFVATKELPIGDRKNMGFMSTLVTYGRGMGIVTATGMDTEIGRIAGMIQEAKEEMTPLQKRLGDLGRVLSIVSLVLCASLFVIAIVFIACALANPALGRTFYIGDIAIGAEVWRVFYAIYAIVMAILFVLSFFVGKPTGGMKAGILKLLIFVPVLVLAFIMGAVLILEFAWWKLIAFMVVSVGLGYGVYYLFRLVDKKCGGAA